MHLMVTLMLIPAVIVWVWGLTVLWFYCEQRRVNRGSRRRQRGRFPKWKRWLMGLRPLPDLGPSTLGYQLGDEVLVRRHPDLGEGIIVRIDCTDYSLAEGGRYATAVIQFQDRDRVVGVHHLELIRYPVE